MKKYNAKLIRDFVKANKTKIKTVHIGMKEDWFWTNKLVYDAKNGWHNFFLFRRTVYVRGICGSYWATPVMLVCFTDGKEEIIPCYLDDGVEASKEDKAEMRDIAKIFGGADDVSGRLTDE